MRRPLLGLAVAPAPGGPEMASGGRAVVSASVPDLVAQADTRAAYHSVEFFTDVKR